MLPLLYVNEHVQHAKPYWVNAHSGWVQLDSVCLTYTHTRTHTCARAHMHTRTHKHTHTRAHTDVHTHAHTHTCYNDNCLMTLGDRTSYETVVYSRCVYYKSHTNKAWLCSVHVSVHGWGFILRRLPVDGRHALVMYKSSSETCAHIYWYVCGWELKCTVMHAQECFLCYIYLALRSNGHVPIYYAHLNLYSIHNYI